MSIDHFIVISALGEFSVFWLLHLLCFRHIKHEDIIKWFKYLYISTNLIGAVFILCYFKITTTTSYSLSIILFIMVNIFTIFSLLVCAYIIEVFGLVESSVNIKILSLIAQSKTKELTQKNITKTYNKRIIIDKRLLRLESSGDLIFYRGKYYLGKRFSVFYLMAQFSRFIDFLYN